MKFSIFLPVKNGLPYIKDCVDSILRQDYKNFTLHILDNNSSDGTKDYLSTLNDERIKISYSDISLSIEDSFERILNMPKEEYMTLIGHDDLFHVDFLSTFKNLIRENPNYFLYQANGYLINSRGKIIRQCKHLMEKESIDCYLKARLNNSKDVSATGYIIKSSIYEKVNGIPKFEKLGFADDALFLKIMELSDKIATNKKCFDIRIHPKSESAVISPDKKKINSEWNSNLKRISHFRHFIFNFSKKHPSIQKILKNNWDCFILSFHQKTMVLAIIGSSFENVLIRQDIKEKIMLSYSDLGVNKEKKFNTNIFIKLLLFLNKNFLLRKFLKNIWIFYSWIRN